MGPVLHIILGLTQPDYRFFMKFPAAEIVLFFRMALLPYENKGRVTMTMKVSAAAALVGATLLSSMSAAVAQDSDNAPPHYRHAAQFDNQPDACKAAQGIWEMRKRGGNKCFLPAP